VYVTGDIGSAGLGLQLAKVGNVVNTDEDLLRYLRPEPQNEVGQLLLDIASSCIDVSDGLAADLSHILEASDVGAVINHVDLPVSKGVRDHCQKTGRCLLENEHLRQGYRY
jgi:thiamine-monophosphate kinase